METKIETKEYKNGYIEAKNCMLSAYLDPQTLSELKASDDIDLTENQTEDFKKGFDVGVREISRKLKLHIFEEYNKMIAEIKKLDIPVQGDIILNMYFEQPELLDDNKLFALVIRKQLDWVREAVDLLEEKYSYKNAPWINSPPEKQVRDKQIWELRNENVSWESIAETAGCGVSTAREAYSRMENSIKPE
jgi:hypothetical protein